MIWLVKLKYQYLSFIENHVSSKYNIFLLIIMLIVIASCLCLALGIVAEI